MTPITPLRDILPELFTEIATPTQSTPTIPAPDLALCHQVQAIDPDRLTYPLLLHPGVVLRGPQAVARIQLEATWLIDAAKEGTRPPARYTTGGLMKDLHALLNLTTHTKD